MCIWHSTSPTSNVSSRVKGMILMVHERVSLLFIPILTDDVLAWRKAGGASHVCLSNSRPGHQLFLSICQIRFSHGMDSIRHRIASLTNNSSATKIK